MAPSVSTSGCGLGCFGQSVGVAVAAGVVGDLVDPAAPEHPDPGPGEHADGVGMVKAPRDRVAIDLGRPWRGVAGVVGQGRDCFAEALVAGPAEADRGVLARASGDRGGAGQTGHGVGGVISWPAVAPLGEHLGGVDPTRAWQRREDRPVRVLTQVGDDGPVQVLDGAVERTQDAPRARTASRRASTSTVPASPVGAARSRLMSSAAGRRPQ